MYKYKVTKDQDTIKNYKKIMLRFSMPTIIFASVFISMMLLFLWIIISIVEGKQSIYMLPIIIILDILTILKRFKSSVDTEVYAISTDKEKEIEFNENGIMITDEDSTRKFSWKAVKEVRIYDEYMSVKFSLIYIQPYEFLFNSFDADKDEIIKDIEQYKEVRR